MNKLLLIVDAQYDFMEGGSLSVNGATEKMNNLVEHITNENYDAIVFTADWHPTRHMSFVNNDLFSSSLELSSAFPMCCSGQEF